MKRTLITILRDRHTSIEEFRRAADQLGTIMALECDELFSKDTVFVDTPLTRTHGVRFKHDPLLVPILRSGIVMLPPFMCFHPRAKVGFVGAKRDEETAVSRIYYCNLPAFTSETPILVLDPMIATGGSASIAIDALKKAGATEKQITLVSFIAAPEGIAHFQAVFPEVNVIVAQVDEKLDERKWIIPGLGDFGDRYFGTVEL